MGAYHYRPIDPGFAAMGRSVSRGIDRGVDAFTQGRERRRQQDRDDLWLDIELAGMGGGRGAVPTERFQEPVGDEPLAVSPDGQVRMPQVGPMRTRQKPGFRPVGPDGFAYIEDPERRAVRIEDEGYRRGRVRSLLEEDEDYARALGQESEGREARRGRIGGPAAALVRGRASDDDISALVGEGVGVGDLLDATQPRTPIRGTEEYLNMLDAEQAVYDRHQNPIRQPGGGRDPGTPTFSQAENWLFDEFGEEELPPDERFDLAQDMARGESPWMEVFPDRGAMAGYDQESVERTMSKGPKRTIRSRTDSRRRTPDTSAPRQTARPAAAPQAGPSITDAAIDSILRANPTLSDEELAAILLRR